MKILPSFIRLLVLLTIAVLGFLVLVPHSFESLGIVYHNLSERISEHQRIAKQGIEKQVVVTNPCLIERGNVPIAEEIISESSEPDSTSLNAEPRLLINRAPQVFDIVCQGDILRFNLYSENVDRIAVYYENEVQQTFQSANIKPLAFKSEMEFEVPKTWLGRSSISATGYVKGAYGEGKIGLATSKVTFSVLDSETGLAVAPDNPSPITKPVRVSHISVFDGDKRERVTQASIINDTTIAFGDIRLVLTELVFGSTISLNNDTARAFRAHLNPAKILEYRELKYLEGSIVIGQPSAGKLYIKFDFSTSNKNLSAEQDTSKVDGIYRVFGEADAVYLDK